MNCANHPEAPVTGYCQQCGKPVCAECTRAVGGQIFCEPCLQARLGMSSGTMSPEASRGAHTYPVVAGLLGFIPGVGAMYNGQFPKALAHVLIFAVFVSLAHESVIFSMLVAAWVFYQVFDAIQTSKARRYGLPLPNPFGLNDLGARMGIPQSSPPPTPSWTPDSTIPPPPVPPSEPWSAAPPPSSTYASVSNSSAAAVPPLPPAAKAPFGAIVLIVVGILLLFQTLGILSGLWIGRGWPLLIIALGVWLLYRRTQETPRGGQQ